MCISAQTMQVEDMDAVLALERRVHISPWSESTFKGCLRPDYCCLTLKKPTELIGYGIMSMAAGEAHLLNLCILPEYQRGGLGKRLLQQLIALAGIHHTQMLFLEVRASNRIAQRLYLNIGFNEIGLRRNYYPAAKHRNKNPQREDAVVMALQLDDGRG